MSRAIVWVSFAVIGIASSLLPRAIASELHFYEHNLSVIAWQVVGDKIRATYKTPRPGLAEVGVKEGTLLFEGAYTGAKIEGTAFVFRRGCQPIPYYVMGEEDGKVITLRGPGPIHQGASCSIKGYSLQSPHSTLKFIYSNTHH